MSLEVCEQPLSRKCLAFDNNNITIKHLGNIRLYLTLSMWGILVLKNGVHSLQTLLQNDITTILQIFFLFLATYFSPKRSCPRFMNFKSQNNKLWGKKKCAFVDGVGVVSRVFHEKMRHKI